MDIKVFFGPRKLKIRIKSLTFNFDPLGEYASFYFWIYEQI